MSVVQTILKRLGLVRPYTDADIDEAETENIAFEASAIERYANMASESASRIVESSSRLSESLREANLKTFADWEHLVHHGERRHVRRH